MKLSRSQYSFPISAFLSVADSGSVIHGIALLCCVYKKEAAKYTLQMRYCFVQRYRKKSYDDEEDYDRDNLLADSQRDLGLSQLASI